MKLDSAFIKLCVCVKKSNFLSWAIRTVFVDPVTFVNGKVWVGSDNQAHDVPSHNCTTIDAC